MKARLAAVAVLVVPLLLLVPGWGKFAYPFQGNYSDLTISHAPNLIFLQKALQASGEAPLWSSAILSGYPFAANPLSGMWYPPMWLIVPLAVPFGFNLLVWLHLLWAGLGMYLYLRSLGNGKLPSLLGGISFELMPKLLGHFAAGHVTLVFAVAWTPWLLLAERKRQQARTGIPLTGLVLGMTALADPRWAAFCGLLWLVYSLYEWAQRGRRGWIGLLGWAGGALTQAGVGILIAAPLLLPLIQYTQLSTRRFMTGSDQMAFALPPLRLFGLLFPDLSGNAEWLLYSGALGLLMLVWVALRPGLNRRYAFWIGILIAAVVYALGLPWITALPGLNLLRVPARALFLAGFGFSVLLSAGVEDLANIKTSSRPTRRFGPGPVLAGVALFAALFAVGASVLNRQILVAFVWGAASLVVLTGLVLLRQAGRLSARVFLVALFPLLVLDLGGVDMSLFTYRSPLDVQSESREIVKYLASREGSFRIYSPSYSLQPLATAESGLQQADGVDPLQLFDYAKFMGAATGIPANGYNVTLPPFQSSDLAREHASAVPDARLLGLLNVKYMAAAFDVQSPDWHLTKRIGETRIYENERWLERAWVQDAQAQPGEGVRRVTQIEIQPDRIRIQAEGPGRLVLSELDYPGWQAMVDGHSAQIARTAGLLRSVDLGPGTHEVVFNFRPLTVYAGIALAGLTWLAILLLSLRKRIFLKENASSPVRPGWASW